MRYTPMSELYRQVRERKLTPQEIEDREKIAKKLPMDDFKKRYGKDAMAVKMATATNIVKKKSEKSEVKEDGHTDVASAIRQCKTVTEDAMQILQKLKSMSPEDSLPSWWTNKLAVASNSMNKLRDYFLVPSVSEEVELNEAEVSVYGFISTGARKKFLDNLNDMRLQFKSKVMNLPQPAPPSGVLKFDANQSTIEAIIKFAKRMKLKVIKEEVELDEKAGDIPDLQKLIGELQNASKMHLAQSKRVQAHVDMMTRANAKGPEGAGGLQDLKKIVGELEKASQAHLRQSKSIDAHVGFMNKMEEVQIDEQFDFVLLDKDNKIVARASGKNAKKEMESSKKSAHLPPMRIPKNEVGKMKIVPISPKDKKDIGDMVLAIGEEVELDENFSPRMIVKLKKIYEPLKGKKINPTPLLKIFDKIDSNKDGLIQLYKADIPFVSTMAMSRLIKKHDMKSDQVKKLREEVELDEMKEPFVVVDTADGNKVVGTASDEKGAKSIITSAELPPMKIKDKKTLKIMKSKKRQMIGQPFKEEYDHIKEMIQSGKFTRPEIKKMIERNILEQRSATGYTLFHRSFSDAMQHAYAFARTKMGMVVDPKEIDNKVATGPKKPGTGKTNSYSLKTNKGMLQIQVYNTGSGAKPFELNMYSS